MLTLDDFDFHLPPELIAQHPAAARSASRLLHVAGNTHHDRAFADLPQLVAPGDVLVFGPESRGLPAEVLADFADSERLRLPMLPGQRSMNLSNAVAVTVFEAWRQQGFAGAI